MIHVVHDSETINPYCDVTQVGSRVYAEHWCTEVFCWRWRIRGNETIHNWHDYGPTSLLKMCAENPSFLHIAANVGFEKDVWRYHLMPALGLPDIPNERWHDILAVAALKALPQSVGGLAPILAGTEKDKEGRDLILSFSKFGKKGHRKWIPIKGHPKSKAGVILPLCERTPEKVARAYEYCASDVYEEAVIHARLGLLPPDEREVWLHDQTVNERGVKIDLDFVRGAQVIVEQSRGPLVRECMSMTGGIEPTQNAKLLAWVNERGVELDNLQKPKIAALLGIPNDEDDDEDEGDGPRLRPGVVGDIPGDVRRVLFIRSLVGSSSIRKLSRMEASVAFDGRAHRLQRYHGTGPGRVASNLFNHLNFPVGTAMRADTHKPEDPGRLAEAIRSGDLGSVEELGLVVEDPPFSGNWRDASGIEAVSSALRHAIVAEEGKLLVMGDFVQCQARINLALAGGPEEMAFLEKLAAGADPYCMTAEAIFKLPPGSLTKANAGDKRKRGKNSFLGCGFMMGADTYCQKYVPGCQCKAGTRCPIEPMPECRGFALEDVRAYRDMVPGVPQSWYGLERAARKAVYSEGSVGEYHGIEYKVEHLQPRPGLPDGKWLVCRLLDGKPIYYWNPQACQMPDRNGKLRERWRYQTVTHGILRWVYPHGGLLTENVVMGLERQLLIGAMLKCEKENLPVIFNTYDEIVCEAEERFASWPVLQQIMEDGPAWAKALRLPIAAEGEVSKRYKK
jgi:DNA polymerase